MGSHPEHTRPKQKGIEEQGKDTRLHQEKRRNILPSNERRDNRCSKERRWFLVDAGMPYRTEGFGDGFIFTMPPATPQGPHRGQASASHRHHHNQGAPQTYPNPLEVSRDLPKYLRIAVSFTSLNLCRPSRKLFLSPLICWLDTSTGADRLAFLSRRARWEC